MLEELKQQVYKANMLLVQYGLVVLTWGNVSGIDHASGIFAIKPSGVPYEDLSPEKMVLVDLNGKVVEGNYRPSSDTPTHIELYKAFRSIGGITHTHSKWATVWAQTGKSIPPLGTTHADTFDGAIPCTRLMTDAEIDGEYEKNTGLVIIESLRKFSGMHMPAVLVQSHGPFAFGKDAKCSVENSLILENVAELAYKTINLNVSENERTMQGTLLRRHFDRKHGQKAYYGQND